MSGKPVYRRVLLKLSGEAFKGSREFGIDRQFVESISRAIKSVVELGVEVAVVVGGGNLFRGAEAAAEGMVRATADYMGMVATVINALALQDALEKLGLETRVQSAIEMREVAEPLIRRRAIRHLEKGRVVIFAAGTGNPYFTTDTAAVLRAIEIDAEVILKATNVDGVYDADPREIKTAKWLPEVDYLDVLRRGLKAMDATAISLSMDHMLPIWVFNIGDPENIRRIICGEQIGTVIRRRSDDRGDRQDSH